MDAGLLSDNYKPSIPNTSTTTTSTAVHSEDSAEVTRLTETLIRVLNKHDFSYQDADGREIKQHVAPDFEGRFHSNPFTINFAEQTDLWKDMVSDYPSIHFDVVDMKTQVRRRSQTASVFLSMAITGVGAVILNGICELWWKHDGERWLLNRHTVMRGPLLEEAFS